MTYFHDHVPCLSGHQYLPVWIPSYRWQDYKEEGYINQLNLRRDTCRLIIRKIQYAPNQTGPGPKLAIMKCFMTSDKPVHMELSLDKEVH